MMIKVEAIVREEVFEDVKESAWYRSRCYDAAED